MQAHPQKTAASDFKRAIGGLGIILAGALTFFLTPLAYALSIGWVQSFTVDHYQSGFEDIVSVAWFSTLGLGIFFLSWALLSTALTLIAMRFAARFL